MTLLKQLALALAIGLLALVGVLTVTAFPFSLEPDSFGWSWLVRGVGPNGRVEGRVVARLPGINRHSPPQVLLKVAPTTGPRATLGVSVDQGPVHRLRTDRGGSVILSLPQARAPGARLDLIHLEETPPVSLRSIEVTPTARPSWMSAWIALTLTGALTLVFLIWRRRVLAIGGMSGN